MNLQLYSIIFGLLIFFSSCATIATSSTQPIVFTGLEGTEILDPKQNPTKQLLGTIDATSTVELRILKGMSSKKMIAQKEGYKPIIVWLDSNFNTTSLWNLLLPFGFIIDYATGKINKYSTTDVVLNQTEMKPQTGETE